MRARLQTIATLLLLGILALSGCSSQGTSSEPAIGTAFVGPATLTIRKDLAVKAPVVATLEHGQELAILEKRRRFYRVRTGKGVVGWTDGNQLLGEEAMRDFRRMSAEAAGLPSQGDAKVFEALNVHTQPARQSPSFYKIPENGVVQIIGHSISPRQQELQLPPIKPQQPAPKPPRKKKESKAVSVRPPMPKPPPLPENWQELSKSTLPPEPEPPAEEPKPFLPFAVKRAVEDDWALIRTPDGRAGWALFSRLFLAIPDEVAQYAEGHRITAYASLGEVRDGDAVHHNWIWGTLSKTLQPFQFDSFRVFIWSKSRHRYETAYIERNVRGYYPLTAEPPSGGKPARFSIVTEDKDGKLVKRTFEFSGYRAAQISAEPYQPAPVAPAQTMAVPGQSQSAAPADASWMARARQSIGRIFGL